MTFAEAVKIPALVTIAMPVAYLVGWFQLRSYYGHFSAAWLTSQINPVVFFHTGALLFVISFPFGLISFFASRHATKYSRYVGLLPTCASIGIGFAVIFPEWIAPDLVGVVKQVLLTDWALLVGFFCADLYRTKDARTNIALIVIVSLGTILLPITIGKLNGRKDGDLRTTSLAKIIPVEQRPANHYVLLSTADRIYGVTLPSQGQVIIVPWEKVAGVERNNAGK